MGVMQVIDDFIILSILKHQEYFTPEGHKKFWDEKDYLPELECEFILSLKTVAQLPHIQERLMELNMPLLH